MKDPPGFDSPGSAATVERGFDDARIFAAVRAVSHCLIRFVQTPLDH
jgi:hypothetical protein